LPYTGLRARLLQLVEQTPQEKQVPFEWLQEGGVAINADDLREFLAERPELRTRFAANVFEQLRVPVCLPLKIYRFF
jgi:hypothetical protein